MRPLHLKIAASAILSVVALVAMRQNAPMSPARNDAGDAREPMIGKRHAGSSRAHAGQARRLTRPDTEVLADTTADITARGSVAAQKDQAAPPDDRSGYQEEPGGVRAPTQERAVRLAANVRLPAAMMAQGDPEPTPHRGSQASETANQAISDTFYGDLLYGSNHANKKKIGNGPDGGSENTVPQVAGPDTGPEVAGEVLISPGPEVDRASQRADEAYRALFGDAAYNRQSMMSAIEVLLPEESADTGK